MTNQLFETLKEGLKNEFDGALNYTYLASKTGDIELRKKMLTYASEEITHALELLNIIERLEGSIGDVSPELVKVDDMLEFMVDYQAKEEAAVFYYNVLTELLDDLNEKEIFLRIKNEENEHYQYIKNLLNKINRADQGL